MSGEATEPKPRRTTDPLIPRLASQRTRFRTERDSARKELADARAAVARLTSENATLATRADASASLKRVDELTAELRTIKHKAVFDRVAKAKGATDDVLDLLYTNSGYKAAGDQADESAIGTLLDGLMAKPGLARLFGEPSPATTTPDPDQPTHPVKPAAGSGQSAPRAKNPGEMIALTPGDERWSDVKFVMGNYDRISAASKERISRGEV